MPQQYLGYGRLDRDFALVDVGLVRAHDGVGHALTVGQIGYLYLAEQPYAVVLQQRLVYYACVLQYFLLKSDAAE